MRITQQRGLCSTTFLERIWVDLEAAAVVVLQGQRM